ncbi:MAG: DUF2124 domain-containing protein [Methanomassiliicoccales archaeon]|nr:DUF2124 domain-containing protein [Methanomassiliicoccales archaeon]
MERSEGITGLTKLFRESLMTVPDGSLVIFLGSEAVCPPFAQLLAYSVRDRGLNFGFAPRSVWNKCRNVAWVEDIGFQIGSEPVDPTEAKVVVLLGGLAIPKFGCEVSDVDSFIDRMPTRPLVIGVGFMDVFRRSLWDRHIQFDILIDGYMSAENLIAPSAGTEELSR